SCARTDLVRRCGGDRPRGRAAGMVGPRSRRWRPEGVDPRIAASAPKGCLTWPTGAGYSQGYPQMWIVVRRTVTGLRVDIGRHSSSAAEECRNLAQGKSAPQGLRAHGAQLT